MQGADRINLSAMLFLGIESSCDETGVALVQTQGDLLSDKNVGGLESLNHAHIVKYLLMCDGECGHGSGSQNLSGCSVCRSLDKLVRINDQRGEIATERQHGAQSRG